MTHATKTATAPVPVRPRVAFCYLVFFLSGVPALIYQVIWQRTLTLYFGVDIYSVTVTIATFMLGLGIGSLVGGHVADRSRRPAGVYGLIELLIAVFGAFSIPLFTFVGGRFAGSPLTIVLLVDFILLLAPTILMGMTLPLMSRVVTDNDQDIGRHLSRLYALNTLGAALGALLSAYLLIGWLGLAGATWVGAAVNVLLALMMLPQGRGGMETSPPLAVLTQPESTSAPPRARLTWNEVRLLSFASGFIALGYQIAWYRILGVILHGTVYVFGTILFFFLVGIAAGAFHAKRRIDEGQNAERFALSQAAIAAYVLFSLALLGHGSMLPGIRHLLSASVFTTLHPSPELAAGNTDLFALYSVGGLLFWAGFLLLVPTYWMGVGFPNLLREGSRSVGELGRSVGGLYFANILGSTAGSLFVGFIEMNYFGTARAALLMTVLGCVCALYVTVRCVIDDQIPWRRLGLITALLLLCVGAFPTPSTLMRAIHFASHPSVKYFGFEDSSGVAVLRKQHQVIAFPQEEKVLGNWRLYIDGATHGEFERDLQNLTPDRELQYTLTSHPAPMRVLSIGLGDGRMCQAAALDPRVRELTIVELSGVLRKTLEQVKFGRDLFASDKIRYIVDDGRRWLLANPQARFDFIMMWPLHAAHSFSGSLYSREFMEILASRLAPGGVITMRSTDEYSTAHTIARQFPHVVRFGSGTYVCSAQPLRFDSRFLPAGAMPSDLLDAIRADRETILSHAGQARLNSDQVLNSEYYLTYPFVRSLQTRLPIPAYEEPDRSRFAQYVVETASAREEPSRQPSAVSP